MRNIPMYHTTEKLQNGQVLKFDVRKPGPGRRLWNREEQERNDTQECIIETKEQIIQRENKDTRTTGQGGDKRKIIQRSKWGRKGNWKTKEIQGGIQQKLHSFGEAKENRGNKAKTHQTGEKSKTKGQRVNVAKETTLKNAAQQENTANQCWASQNP